jgi:ATP-dependent Lhr-like helicase
LPGSEGRWTLDVRPSLELASTTERQTALAAQLIERYGIVTRELITSEGIAGGFSGLYPVFKAMEEAGRIRRGYFVAGLGAAQFAAPGAEDRLREYRDSSPAVANSRAAAPKQTPPPILAATDPANPYGTALRWPERPNENIGRPGRVAGSRVIIHDGQLLAYLGRTGQSLTTFLPTDEPERNAALHALARALADLATTETAVFLSTIDGGSPATSPLAAIMQEFDFVLTSRGLLHRRLTDQP